MYRTVAHRGPDGEGVYVDEHAAVGLGHTRLSIIDLETGSQPMSNPEKDVWVVFNGEIYNFRALRGELQSHGHVFQTHSDTEVLIHGYEQWGSDLLLHLNGMFAFGLWDARNRRLLLARDRAGIKPLYYRLDEHGLEFASEIRALAAPRNGKAGVNPAALNMFLRYRFVPSPLTLFEGIAKLAPGTRLMVENGNVRVDLWANVKPSPQEPAPSPSAAREGLQERYGEAVRSQLVADVPVGLLLSGGVDSALLLALMNRNGHCFQTYTVGFGDSFADDELADGADTARAFNSPNVAVRIDRRTFETALPAIVGALEEPVASPSVIPMYFVCQRARQDVKVVLMGQGPDELMGGYLRHLGAYYGGVLRGLPRSIATRAISLGRPFLHGDSARRTLDALLGDARSERYQNILSIMNGSAVDGLFHDGLLPASAAHTMLDCWQELLPLIEHTDELGGFQFLEVRSWLPDALLLYADKLSMAHGLEVRVPYLDNHVIDFAERLPSRFKIHRGERKWLHRRVCRELLPARILRRRKRNFAATVVDKWFMDCRDPILQRTLLDRDSRVFQYLKPEKVQELVAAHRNGRQDYHKIIFSLAVLEEWLRSIAA